MFEIIRYAIDILLHLDSHLMQIVDIYGIWIYAFLFLIIFCETGLVLTPFLPGDSLLFVLGTLAAQDTMNLWVLMLLLTIAAILGDTINYWFGNKFGEQIFIKNKLINKEYLFKTQEFYRVHGGKTIILARFIPIVRTFAPFIAGIGKMDYKRFLSFNVIGGIVWVNSFLLAGYFFGGIPWVQENLVIVILFISITSLIPPLYDFLRHNVSKGMTHVSKIHSNVSTHLGNNMKNMHSNFKKMQHDMQQSMEKQDSKKNIQKKQKAVKNSPSKKSKKTLVKK